MKKEFEHVKLTDQIIGCAINVHRELGPGFLEKVYEHALCIELDHQGISYNKQVRVPLSYRSMPCGIHCLDLVVGNLIVVELKATKALEDIHFAVVLSYLKASNLPVALLLNFAGLVLAIRRFGNRVIEIKNLP